MKSLLLSKSDFQIGRRCHKRLWNEKHGEWRSELSATNEKNAFEGNRFNDAIQALYPDGIMVGWGNSDAEAAVQKTKELLTQDAVVLFEAFFIHEGLLCLADIVIKEGDQITLIEAKSSNNPKIKKKDNFEHIYDAAFQAFVMQQCGVEPTQIKLLHANGECVWPDKERLFHLLDITEEAKERFDEVRMISERLLSEVNAAKARDVTIGKFCKKPADKACPHIEECWSRPTARTIYDLPRLSESKIALLQDDDIHLIEDIPQSADLTQSNWDVVNLIQNETEFVDMPKLKDMLDKLEYPIHFFDFETYNPAVPMYNQSRPWQQVPFQYSLHILHSNGEVEHHEYLHCGKSDPRPELIEAMKQHFLDSGSIVVYYAPFETSRIKEIAQDFPEHREFLLPLNKRIWDQLDAFKYCFEDHRLALSKSIKVVLPTFIPELSYKTLSVQKGDQAQLEWRKMIDIKWEPTRNKKADELRAYCELDTLAMVRLHDYLLSLTK
jgi:hypothetical protein